MWEADLPPWANDASGDLKICLPGVAMIDRVCSAVQHDTRHTPRNESAARGTYHDAQESANVRWWCAKGVLELEVKGADVLGLVTTSSRTGAGGWMGSTDGSSTMCTGMSNRSASREGGRRTTYMSRPAEAELVLRWVEALGVLASGDRGPP